MSELDNLPDSPIVRGSNRPLRPRELASADMLIAYAARPVAAEIATTSKERLALMRKVKARMIADGRLPPPDMYEALS